METGNMFDLDKVENNLFENGDANLDDDDDDDYEELANQTKIRPTLTHVSPNSKTPVPVHPPTTLNQHIDNDNDETDNEDDDDDLESVSNMSKSSRYSNESEKLDLMMKLDTLRSRGHIVREFNLKSPLLDIKKEERRVTHSIALTSSIKFQQKILMAIVSALEYGNKRFDPCNIELDGWSENVFENIEDFNNVFERLYEKYKKRGEMLPEIELMLTLAGSAFMFNMSKQLFKTVQAPFQGQMRNIRESVRNAFHNTHPEQHSSPVFQQQQQTPFPSNIRSPFTSANTVPPPSTNSEESNLRKTQLEAFLNQNNTLKTETEDHDDIDRFSIASSSCGSVIEPPSIPMVKSKTKTKNKKQTINQRSLVI